MYTMKAENSWVMNMSRIMSLRHSGNGNDLEHLSIYMYIQTGEKIYKYKQMAPYILLVQLNMYIITLRLEFRE